MNKPQGKSECYLQISISAAADLTSRFNYDFDLVAFCGSIGILHAYKTKHWDRDNEMLMSLLG
jgi:hypothetical protein